MPLRHPAAILALAHALDRRIDLVDPCARHLSQIGHRNRSPCDQQQRLDQRGELSLERIRIAHLQCDELLSF